MRLIAKSLGVAAVLVAAYCLVIQFTAPDITRAPSQYLNNRLAIEDFLYRDDVETVFAGSSLTRRLTPDALGPHAANVAVSAGDALTGLRIVLASGHRPKRLLFEINKIDLGLDRTLVDDVFAEPLYNLRRPVRALRLGYQPMNVLYNLLRRGRPEEDAHIAPENQRRAIDRYKKLTGVPVPQDELDRNIALLRAMAAEARARHIQLVLFEMPILPELENLRRPSQIRAAVRRAFPPARSCWLYPVLPGGVHTLDGLHLMTGDARSVAAQLMAEPVCNAGR